MGRERIGAGKLICFYLACLIGLSLSGCTAVKEEQKPVKEEEKVIEKKEDPQKIIFEHLRKAKELLSHGDYQEALKENNIVLQLSDNSYPGDEALFNMGLIYAHYKNPRKNYKRSTSYFNKILKDFPQSPLIEQARIWIGVLQVIEKSKQVDIDIEEMKKGLSQ